MGYQGLQSHSCSWCCNPVTRIQDDHQHCLEKYLTINLYELESHLIPLCMGYQGLENHSWSWCCNPVTRIQNGRHNGPMKKASGVDVLLTAAFGGVAGIITGTSWTNALRAYRLITTVLLQNFFQSCAKTYQELSEYLKAVREDPVGWLWVDCLIKPTPLALQLLHAQRADDFLLQQVSLEAMTPYFFVAGHRPGHRSDVLPRRCGREAIWWNWVRMQDGEQAQRGKWKTAEDGRDRPQ